MKDIVQIKNYLAITRCQAHDINGGEVMITGQYWHEWIRQKKKKKEDHENLLKIIREGIAYKRRKVWKQLRYDLGRRWLRTA